MNDPRSQGGTGEPAQQAGPAEGPPSSAADPVAGPQAAGTGIADDGMFEGRYRLDRVVGRGGMGKVYLATQLAVDRPVAIKILDPQPEDGGVLTARFKREARVIAALQHPNIVNLIDFGQAVNGQLYLVMEYIDGDSMKTFIQNEAPLEARRVVDIAIQVTEALVAAHANHTVHRDLKPDNIMVVRNVSGREDFIKVLDFGIAKVKHDSSGPEDTVQTKAGLIVGSLRYISPEQVETKEITPQTDLYSMATILYELLVGRRLFDHAAPADCAIAHLTETPSHPVIDGRELHGPLVDFILQCLAKDPGQRPASAAVALATLRAMRDAPLADHAGALGPTAAAPDRSAGHVAGFVAAPSGHATSPSLTPGYSQPLSAQATTQVPVPTQVAASASTELRSSVDCELDLHGDATRTAVASADMLLNRPITTRARGFQGHGAFNLGQAAAHGAPPHAATTSTVAAPGSMSGGMPAPRSALGMVPPPGTATHPVAVRLPTQPMRPLRRRSSNNIFMTLLALIGLAAIGAALYVLVIHPNVAPSGSRVTPTPVRGGTVDRPPAPHSEATIERPEPRPTPSPVVPANGIRLTSAPSGALVFRKGEALGETPLLITISTIGEPPRLRLVRSGYEDLWVTLDADDRGKVREVRLTPSR